MKFNDVAEYLSDCIIAFYRGWGFIGKTNKSCFLLQNLFHSAIVYLIYCDGNFLANLCAGHLTIVCI